MPTWLSRSFILFCIVGVISSLIDIAVLFVLVEYAQAPVLIAAAIALLLASVNGYLLNKKLTFKNTSTRVKTQYFFYLFVSIISLFFTLSLLHFFIEAFGMYYLYAKLITIVVVTAWSYSANKFLVFKAKA